MCIYDWCVLVQTWIEFISHKLSQSAHVTNANNVHHPCRRQLKNFGQRKARFEVWWPQDGSPKTAGRQSRWLSPIWRASERSSRIGGSRGAGAFGASIPASVFPGHDNHAEEIHRPSCVQGSRQILRGMSCGNLFRYAASLDFSFGNYQLISEPGDLWFTSWSMLRSSLSAAFMINTLPDTRFFTKTITGFPSRPLFP